MPGANGGLHDFLGLESTFGAQHMLHRRRRALDGIWETCTPRDQGHMPDSGLHRYSRVVGFAVSEEERHILGMDALAAQAEEAARNTDRFTSHLEVVYRWSLFERYLLEHHADTPYAQYIQRLRLLSATDDEHMHHDVNHIKFEAPPAVLLLAYARMLRNRPLAEGVRKGSYIRLLVLKTVGQVLHEFAWAGENKPNADPRVINLLESYGDTQKSAIPFDMADDLPKLYHAVWTLYGWTYKKGLQAWAMILFCIVFMQRTSDMTTHSTARCSRQWRCHR